jgi:Holliday junction resolvasome RuvABC endonuclease subunit
MIGFDPGLAAFGVAVADVDRELHLTFRRIAVVRTSKSHAKTQRGFDDLSNRCRELYREVFQVAGLGGNNYDDEVVAICVEAVALPFGKCRSSVVSALGRVRGLIDAMSEEWRIPVVEETAQEVKRRLTGSRKATKEEMLEKLVALYPETRGLLPPQTTLHEHAADAAAVIHAALNSDVVRVSFRAKG